MTETNLALVHCEGFFVECSRIEVCGDHCGECNGMGEYPVDVSHWATLAHNIAVGAALCAAFELGYSDAEDNALYYRFGYRLGERWTPGCGRPNDWHVLP